MCGNTRRDKVRNEDIRTKIGVPPIKEKMREPPMMVWSCATYNYRCASPTSRAYQIRTS